MKITFLDGAMGTNIMKAGLPKNACGEEWILNNRDVVLSLQKAYVDAGADIIYAPTFGADEISLSHHGLEARHDEINKGLVAISKEAVSGSDVKIAGDISPTGLMMLPSGEYTYGQIRKIFEKQARVLEDCDVDLFVLETFSSLSECLAAFDGVRAVSEKDVIATLTLEKNGKTLSGDSPEGCLVALQARGVKAFGINCSSGIKEMAQVISRLKKIARVPIIAKPNAGMPLVVNGETVFPLDGKAFGEECECLVESGALYLGGCCGTTPEHIKSLKLRFGALETELAFSVDSHVTNGRDIFSVSEIKEIPPSIPCDDELLFSAPEKGEAQCVAVKVENADNVNSLVENTPFLELPVVIDCNELNLLEEAVKMYSGKCIVKSAVNTDVLKKKYGFLTVDEIV